MQKKTLSFIGLGILLSWWAANPLFGQPERRNPGRGSRPGSDGSASLNRAGLRVGMKMPEIKVHDDQGKPLNTASLKGSYTVLTFGCLT